MKRIENQMTVGIKEVEQDCFCCNGQGKIREIINDDEAEFPCGNCEGTGRVMVLR